MIRNLGRIALVSPSALIAALSCLSLSGCAKIEAKTEAPKPPVVLYSYPKTQVVSDFEDFTGQTMAVKMVEVRARVTGYLDKVNFVDGVEVNEGDVLFVIDPRSYTAEVHRTQGNVAQAEAHQKTMDRNYRRASGLFGREVLSREEHDKVLGDYSESLASVEVARAQLEMARLNLDFTEVKAPISGRTSRRMVDPGNLVRQDDTMLTSIVSLDPMYVYFDIDERTLLKLRRLTGEGKIKSRADGNTIKVLIGLSDEEDFPHEGEINFTDNQVNSSTGTLRVRGVVPNPKPRLLSPGLFVRIRLPVGDPHESVVIPEKAVQTDQGKKYAYVINDKNKVEYRDVKVGSLTKTSRVIDSGLKTGERVIVVGGQRVRPGAEVSPEEYKDLTEDKSEKSVAAVQPAGSAETAKPSPPAAPAPEATRPPDAARPASNKPSKG
jgi:RND family efflux transporter MFP subunit